MERNLWRAWAASLTAIVLAWGTRGQSNTYNFSKKAVESVPDIVQRANSPDLKDRLGVLEQLVFKDPLDDVQYHYRFRYDLPAPDYCTAALSVLDGDLLRQPNSEDMIEVFGRITYVTTELKQAPLFPYVVRFLDYDNPSVQEYALEALGAIEGKQYVEQVAKAAMSPNLMVKRAAVRTLAGFNAKEAVPGLIRCLEDDDFYNQRTAVEALGRIGDKSAVPHLIPLLKTKVNSWVLRELVRMDAREAVPSIKELYYPGQRNANETLTALAYFGDEQAISEIMMEMVDGDEQTRGGVLLDSLVAVNARAVAPALIRALESEKTVGGQASRGSGTVEHMMMALAKLQAKEAVPVLHRYLRLADDRSQQGRSQFFASRAIEALGILKAREAVPGLAPILDFTDRSLRTDAQIALARIGEPSMAERVVASLQKYRSSSNHVEVLEELANVSDPNTYLALSQMTLPTIEGSTCEEYLRQLTAKSGVEFTFGEKGPLPETRRKPVAALGSPTGLSALRRVIETLNYSGPDYAVFIRDRVVRVVTVEGAYDLWDRWMAEYKRNHPAPGS
jgi:HEAT repeat protein